MSDEEFEQDDDGLSVWEERATSAVDSAIEEARLDEIEQEVIIADETGDPRMSHYCRTIDGVQEALEAIYDQAWYGYVPFDSGEAVFDSNPSDYVSAAIKRSEISSFFSQFGEEPEGEVLLKISDLIKKGGNEIIRIDFADINDQLITYLAKHPEKMRELAPRKFEELVADLFKSKGYEVTLTPRTRDGGLDICAVQSNDIGKVLVIIECKRYAAQNKVGVEIIRGLYGVVEQKRATKGLLATTSYFTRDAKLFHSDLQWRIGLADFDNLCGMLNEWKRQRSK